MSFWKNGLVPLLVVALVGSTSACRPGAPASDHTDPHLMNVAAACLSVPESSLHLVSNVSYRGWETALFTNPGGGSDLQFGLIAIAQDGNSCTDVATGVAPEAGPPAGSFVFPRLAVQDGDGNGTRLAFGGQSDPRFTEFEVSSLHGGSRRFRVDNGAILVSGPVGSELSAQEDGHFAASIAMLPDENLSPFELSSQRKEGLALATSFTDAALRGAVSDASQAVVAPLDPKWMVPALLARLEDLGLAASGPGRAAYYGFAYQLRGSSRCGTLEVGLASHHSELGVAFYVLEVRQC